MPTREEMEACLRDVGTGLTLQRRWLGEGERRGVLAYGRRGGVWHAPETVVALARRGLLEDRGIDGYGNHMVTLSDAGRDWLAAHPS